MSGPDLRSAAQVLGGDIVGAQILFAPPGHSRQDRSASLRFDPKAPGGFVIHSFAGDDPLSIRDYVKERLGLASGRQARLALCPAAPVANPDDTTRTAQTLIIWDEARDPRGSPVEAYLHRTGLVLPDEAAGEAIRFHPACPFAGERTPAMICLVRDVVTNKPKALHRTALTHDGHKAKINGKDRMALGPIAGGVVKLTPDENVTLCLGIGEGIESALSLRNLPEFGCSPVWSLISAGGVDTFPVLPGIESLWFAVDHDETGIRAARSTARRWRTAGAETYLITPTVPHTDLNDLFFAGAHNA
jgi:putative DNA primase/helicase